MIPNQEVRFVLLKWFTDKKRALLSEYGVGTVDQALLPNPSSTSQFCAFVGACESRRHLR